MNPLLGPADGSFTRGLVAAACLSAFQDRRAEGSREALRRIVRHGLQGGVALSAGSQAAMAVRQGNYLRALTLAAAGATGVLLVERCLGGQGERGHE